MLVTIGRDQTLAVRRQNMLRHDRNVAKHVGSVGVEGRVLQSQQLRSVHRSERLTELRVKPWGRSSTWRGSRGYLELSVPLCKLDLQIDISNLVSDNDRAIWPKRQVSNLLGRVPVCQWKMHHKVVGCTHLVERNVRVSATSQTCSDLSSPAVTASLPS